MPEVYPSTMRDATCILLLSVSQSKEVQPPPLYEKIRFFVMRNCFFTLPFHGFMLSLLLSETAAESKLTRHNT